MEDCRQTLNDAQVTLNMEQRKQKVRVSSKRRLSHLPDIKIYKVHETISQPSRIWMQEEMQPQGGQTNPENYIKIK